jgi:hypothetical protein
MTADEIVIVWYLVSVIICFAIASIETRKEETNG